MKATNMKTAFPIIMVCVFIIIVVTGCGSTNSDDPTSPNMSHFSATSIYSQISPSIAFIDTPNGTGSGILLEDGYVLTCAHVVWPFDEVWAIFPDGSEYTAKVVNSDMLNDLAVLGPIDTNIPTLSLSKANMPAIGRSVFVIGYPGENDYHPQATLTSGIISRFRHSEFLNLTYIQTDATGTGGQSGGALISDDGDIFGMINFNYGDVFGLAISSADILSNIEKLIDGKNISGLGQRWLPTAGGRPEHQVTLSNLWDERIFIVNELAGTPVNVVASSENDILLSLKNAEEWTIGKTSVSLKTEYDSPSFLIVKQRSAGITQIEISSTSDLIPFVDTDDNTKMEVGETIVASIDCPGDLDYFTVDLFSGQEIEISVESIQIDPYITIIHEDAQQIDEEFDDDSGGGLFGTNSRLIYKAPQDGTYFISVTDAFDDYYGGYCIAITETQ